MLSASPRFSVQIYVSRVEFQSDYWNKLFKSLKKFSDTFRKASIGFEVQFSLYNSYYLFHNTFLTESNRNWQ